MRTKLTLAFCALFLTALAGVAHAAAIPAQGVVAVDAGTTTTTTASASKTASPDPTADTGSNAAPAPALTSPSAFSSLAASGSSGPTPSIIPGLSQPGLSAQPGLPYPSDQFGAIGPDYYVQSVTNMGIAVYRRSDLAQVAGPVSLTTFAAAPNQPEVVDSQLMWDSQTSRWYYAFTYKKWVNNVRSAGILYGWSKTSDPTDLEHGWCQMRIDNGADFDDRPKLGDNANYLIMATNADPATGNDYDRVWTMPKPPNGSTTCPASQTGVKVFGSVSQPLKTSDGDVADSLIAAQDNDGSANGWIVSADDQTATSNQLMLWHVNASGDLVADGNIAVSSYSAPPGVPQPSPNAALDPIDQRLNSAIADTDPDVGATAVWTSHTIADPAGTGRSVVRWYELVPSACAPVTAGVCSSAVRRQQGQVSDPTNWLFNAAMAPTDAGNEAVLHYDSASASQLVQVRARSRVSNTPLGTLGSEIVVDTSDAAYDEPTCHDSRPYCRWGDYAAATTDPSDPHAVWGSNQAIGPANGGNMHWKTRNFAIQPSAAPALLHSATGAVDAAPGGDGDGVVEPGESINLTQTVRNAGGAGATGVSGTLSSGSAGLSVTSASSAYPDVPAGGTATGSTPFGASVSSSVGCGTPLSMGVTLNTAQGRYRVPLTLATGAAGTAQSTGATDVPKAIPDGSTTGVTSSINVTSPDRVSDLNVTIGRIDHTWLGDLKIELIGPDGTTVMLADRPGGYLNGDNNMVGTVFDDEAPVPLSAGAAPYTGSFKPAGRLSAFDGKPLQGTWALKVVDDSPGDSGNIVAWSVRATPALCDVASNTPPAAGFTATPQPAVTGQTLTFSSTSSDPDGSVASQAWDLDNDGQFNDGTGVSASRSFAKPGTYTVRLRVTDNRGASSIATKTVTIDNRPPVASFTAAPDPALTGQSITLTSTSTDPDGSVAAHAWDLNNDGVFDNGSGATATTSFPKAGSYTVRLRETDDLGATSTVTRTVTVDNRAPAASFTVSPSAPSTGDAVTFTSSSTDPDGTIASQAWDTNNDGVFDDGTGVSASKSFAKAGAYTVRLRVTDDSGATATTSQVVTVANRAPVASFGSAPAAPSTGDPVTFTSSSTDPDGTIASQAWDTNNDGVFDDGTGATASKTFAKAGTYTVRLRVTDDSGATATTSQVVTVANRAPVASFGSAPAAPSTGDQVTFTSSSTDPDGTIASQAWDTNNDGAFDDGTGTTASKTFAKAGTYTVRLRVTDDNGATDTVSHTVSVANRPPTAGFTISPNPTSTGQTVTFQSTSSDPDGTLTLAWDLNGDGQFDSGRTGTSESRTYSAPGAFTIKLQVTDDNGATATKTATLTIDNRAPTAKFSFTPAAPTTNDTVTFTSESTDPDGAIASQAWDLNDDGVFDDGTGASATRAFAKGGPHAVHLLVTDANGGTSVATQTVTVDNRPPTASFTVDPQTVITGQPSHLDAAGSTDPDGTIRDYLWDLDGDGVYETDTGTSPVTSRFWGNPGNVIVGLKVTDDQGKTATTQRTVTVNDAPPFADGPTVPPPDTQPLPGDGDQPPTPAPGPTPTPTPQPKPGKPPRGSVRVLTHNLREALRRGLPVRFSSSEAATARFAVTMGRTTVASKTKLVGTGRASLRLKLSQRPRGMLTVTMTLIGPDSLSKTYSVRVNLR